MPTLFLKEGPLRFRILSLCLLVLVALAAGCQGDYIPTETISPMETFSPMPTPVPTAVSTPTPASKTPLVVFCAGSLILPFDQLEKAFESRYPEIDVQNECHGSIQVIRHVTDLHEKIDVVVTADASLIPMLMYATPDPESGKPYAEWYIRFATNKLGVAYQPQSKYAAEINTENWYTVLPRPDIKVGIADPRFDPSGYRTLMVFSLAQELYQNYSLYNQMFQGKFSTPITYFADDDLTTITVPEIVETKPGASIVIRGASIQLIALLQSGDLDFAFEYESVIQQHGLQMIHLPDALNLGSVDFEDFYRQVQVNLDFRRFASVKPEFKGERIGYGVTIPSNALHLEAAVQYIAYLLGPEGRALMEANYHPLFETLLANNFAAVPQALQELVAPEPQP
ncbi:MAG: tungstate ABC transporter substrate-binding protein WtpA [Anaerolineales bacterium]|nr:tungstate ABC transporter substrate-binding protein WtpA [Anaerolineales bacterium]